MPSQDEWKIMLQREQIKVKTVQDNYAVLGRKFERLWNQTNSILIRMSEMTRAINDGDQTVANERLKAMISEAKKLDSEMRDVHDKGHPAIML